ncbi:MAG: CocE/NonD family hydrolase [Solirubrobacteraceae bacterium]
MIRRGSGFAAVVALLLALGAGSASAEAALVAHGSAEQVYATDLAPGTPMVLLDATAKVVRSKKADAQGSVLFRGVKPGDGYRIRPAAGGEPSAPVTVLSGRPAPPSTDVYDQKIPSSGYGYITMRDGTKLAIYVRPAQDVTSATPLGKLPEVPAGPQPTLIEYAGYGYADPAGPQSGIATLANIMGFTVVNVNMRGTGCSGGAFDFFERLQSLDGYDVIETVARQPWVLHNKVGMLGISYGGISQLFTAETNPPSLAAITPLSLIDQVQTTLFPGGILNTGFALEWAKQRVHDALPAGPDAGQAWAYKRIQEGDEVCKDNQKLHGQAVDLLGKIKANTHYRPKVADPLSPVTFVHNIKVPTFLACQWEDEQTGGHCPTLAAALTGTDKKWVTFTNGTHVDSLGPETYNRLYDFLMLYVARQAPIVNAARVQATSPVVYQAAMGIDGVTLPADPIQQEPTYESALAAFEKLDQVRVLFDNGAGRDPGQPFPGFEQSFKSWPVPGTKGRTWYLGAGGALRDARETARSADVFTWDAKARPMTSFTGDTAAGENGLWTALPPYRWQSPPEGSAVSYVSAPLSEDTVVLGAGALRFWLKATKKNVDLQATVTEVRPDGKEVFVQGGWLRADERALDKKKSTPLAPILSLRKRDVAPVPSKRFVPATMPLYYQGHAYRKGSRIRVYITAVNSDQPIWAFATAQPKGTATVTIGRGATMPSRLTLPVVSSVKVPTALPPCPGLRAEPCRTYEEYANTSVQAQAR